MKVLITGGLGGLGQHVAQNLISKGHEVLLFDLKNINTLRIAKEFPKDNVFFGDITKPETYIDLISQVDCIIHMAFIITPLSETLPFAYDVNVIGTKNLVEACEKLNPNVRFVFASSVSVFGPTAHFPPPVTVERPANPINNYTRHKWECEEILRTSKLNWVILRIAEALYLKIDLSPKNLERMYEIPYNQRVEFIHPHDVATAFANAATRTDFSKELLIISGGEKCRMRFHEQVDKIFECFNLPPADPKKFSTTTYYLDYYDTKRSQELLNYQEHTFDDWIEDFKSNMGSSGEFIKFFAPIAKFFI